MFEKLRAKPESVRKQLALGTTIIIFGAIFFVWWSSWDARTGQGEARAKTASPTESIKRVFQGFSAEVKGLYSQSVDTQPEEMAQKEVPATSTFDTSGMIVIDRSATSSVREGNNVLLR